MRDIYFRKKSGDREYLGGISIFKVLIADDEPKIRRGIQEAFDWESLNMTVIGTAADGREALRIAEQHIPDICLVDICMPFANGLEVVDKLKQLNPRVITIIISGYDKFEYAQHAVKLKVFDYLLKPINEETLLGILNKAAKELTDIIDKDRMIERANQQLKKSMPFLREKFILEWLLGYISAEEIDEHLEFYNIRFENEIGLLLIKTSDIRLLQKPNHERENQLQLFSIQGILEEVLQPFSPFYVLRDEADNMIALASVNDKKEWAQLRQMIENRAETCLEYKIPAYQGKICGGYHDVPMAYEDMKRNMTNESNYLPVIKEVKHYIQENYTDHSLSLKRIADHMNISLNYLSKLFKQETGVTFIEYLIKIRIREAIKLMNDPNIKIYEIAEKVGYSSQHYFSSAFKKVLGVTPSEYKTNCDI